MFIFSTWLLFLECSVVAARGLPYLQLLCPARNIIQRLVEHLGFSQVTLFRIKEDCPESYPVSPHSLYILLAKLYSVIFSQAVNGIANVTKVL